MRAHEFDEILAQTFEDGHLSRSERKAIAARIDDAMLDAEALAELRARAFAFARKAVERHPPEAVVDWLEDIVKALGGARLASGAPRAEVCFSPGTACRERIVGLLRSCRSRADICVFTITDDAITEAIIEAHRRGIALRVLSDNHKSSDPGSDLDQLERAGVPIAIDRSDKHMHHKFAIFDATQVLTGSYNWTRSAADWNEENLVVLEDPRLVRDFSGEFDRLWTRYFTA